MIYTIFISVSLKVVWVLFFYATESKSTMDQQQQQKQKGCFYLRASSFFLPTSILVAFATMTKESREGDILLLFAEVEFVIFGAKQTSGSSCSRLQVRVYHAPILILSISSSVCLPICVLTNR